jgi:hypothetical protein
MRAVYTTLVCFVLAAGCNVAPKLDSDFTPLFNGQDLSGWVIESNAAFGVRDGLLVVNKGTGWLRSVATFGDAVFRLDFRFLEDEANSGIFVRTAATSKKDANGWPDNGYQVQCMDTLKPPRHVASMIPYGGEGFTDENHESDLDKIKQVYRGAREWNTYEITCRGEELTVKLNGFVVTKAWNIKNSSGHVGIQAEHGLLEFRNLGVKTLE